MFFPATVTRYPYASKDAHHSITWGTAGSLSCKYSKMSKKIQDQNGDEVLTSAWLMFPVGTSFNYDDKIVLPDGTFPKIVKVHNVKNHVNADVCVEVYLGEA